MCRVLDVSVSGFYAWKRRPLCTRKREDGELATRIEETFVQNRQVYGSPRIHAELQAQGIHCGRKRVVRLMRQLHLSARCPKKHIVTTQSDPAARFAPNVLQQNFEALAPNTRVGRRCDFHWDAGGMALPGCGAGPVLACHCRLGDGGYPG
jgi:transposase InsO family protein